MDKRERNEAADLIESHVSFSDRAEIKLECGMIVRCNNNPEALKACADKFRKRRAFNSPLTSSKLKPASTYKVAMGSFIKDGEIDNAIEYAKLHGKNYEAQNNA